MAQEVECGGLAGESKKPVEQKKFIDLPVAKMNADMRD